MSVLTSKAFLIFSGYNQRAIVSFCREAVRLNVPFFIIAKSMEDSLFNTQYKKQIVSVRSEKMLLLSDVDRCIDEVKRHAGVQELVILPSSEFLNRFFLVHRAHYQMLDCRIPLVSSELYATISDKYSFGELCSKYGLMVPLEFDQPEQLAYPFVAKPRLYFTDDQSKTLQPYLILSDSDWADFSHQEKMEDFYFQEFIEGSCYYLLFYLNKGQAIVFSQQNLVQQSGGKSMIVSKSAHIHELSICERYIQMLQSEGFEGLIMIELKKKADEFVMIEANPRLWGPSQLFVDAGVPLFEAFVRDQGFEVPPTTLCDFKDVTYFWHGGMVQDQMAGKQLAFHDFSAEMLTKKLNELLDNEIYRRTDTIELFYNESKGIC